MGDPLEPHRWATATALRGPGWGGEEPYLGAIWGPILLSDGARRGIRWAHPAVLRALCVADFDNLVTLFFFPIFFLLW